MTVSDPRWRFVGRLCLDFAMTGGRGEWAHFERFNEPGDLGDWCAQGPLKLRDVRVDDDELRRAGDLRDAIQRVAFALVAGHKSAGEHVAVLNAFAAAAPLARTLDPESLTLSITKPASVEALLSELARDALDLAADPQARGRVRQCASPDCALVFYDDSRPGQRRWCSAGRCGDRARARAYRARKTGREHERPGLQPQRRRAILSPTGLTKDAGWQIGVSRTLPVDPGVAWDFLVSPAGLRLWLGEVTAPLAKGAEYQTRGGTTGQVRSLRPRDRVRLTYKPEGREQPATVQVTVTSAAGGTVVRFHTERLVSDDERERFRQRWRETLDRIEAQLA